MAAPPPYPSGTVAFLFTDIEGSTRLWERDRVAMATAVDRQLTLLTEAVAAARGVLFKVIGDGTQSAFWSVADAVMAAIAAQHACLDEPWPATTGPLAVRMAIHVGAATPRGGDYLAPCLNRLGRLIEAGHGRQILLSEAAANLVRSDLPPSARLRDLGPHRLRDLLEPEHIFQLLAPGLPDGFPPLQTLDRRPHNLPVQPTPFIGRTNEVARVVALLAQQETRLLTLTGVGGVGKTRLALQAAAETADQFPDGVWFVSLAPVSDPALVPAAIAGALGVREEAGQPLAATLAASLQDRRLLLLLDNFEHLDAAAPIVSGLLGAAPGAKVLATSRAPLHIRGEREFVVPPMALPAIGAPQADPADAEAVRLFLARARDIRPDLAVDRAALDDIAAICRQLDGLPLAIELAAARVNVLPPAALRRRLSERLRLLTGGARDAPERQRTLRDTIAWSYDLLSPAEQAFFRRLGVFAGGWTLEAATAVSGPGLDGDLLDALTELIDQSLAFLAPGVSGATEPRYGMLETLREFALDRLAAAGEAPAIRRRLVEFLVAFADDADRGLQGPEQSVWLDRLEAEHDNLRSVLGQTLEAGDGAAALRLAGGLWRFWRNRGYPDEGRTWLLRALASAPTAPAALRARARDGLGHLAVELGDYPAAQTAFADARDLFARLDDRKGLADALSGLGIVAVNLQAYDDADDLHRQALTIRRVIGDRRGEALSLRNLGIVARERGKFGEATTLQEQSLAIWRELGETIWIAHTLLALGELNRLQGRDEEARRQCGDSLALLDHLGDRFGQAVAEMQLGRLAQRAGDPAGALARYGAALTAFRTIGVREGVIESIEWIAGAALDLGQADRAVPLYAAASRWRAELALPPPSATDAADIARDLARAKATAGDWTPLWQAGQQRDLDQAAGDAASLAASDAAPSPL